MRSPVSGGQESLCPWFHGLIIIRETVLDRLHSLWHCPNSRLKHTQSLSVFILEFQPETQASSVIYGATVSNIE